MLVAPTMIRCMAGRTRQAVTASRAIMAVVRASEKFSRNSMQMMDAMSRTMPQVSIITSGMRVKVARVPASLTNCSDSSS